MINLYVVIQNTRLRSCRVGVLFMVESEPESIFFLVESELEYLVIFGGVGAQGYSFQAPRVYLVLANPQPCALRMC